MRRYYRALTCAGIAMLAVLLSNLPRVHGEEDTLALIKSLGSPDRAAREHAIEALTKLGDAAREPLIRSEADLKMDPQHISLVRHLLGDRLIATTQLTPVDLTTVAPFGEDKEKGVKGDPSILINLKSKLIVMNGEFVLEQGPLEYLVCVKHSDAKLHETVVGVHARPRDICYALLACAYTYAGEKTDDGNIKLPPEAGILISLEYEWEKVNADMTAPGPDPSNGKGEKKWVRVPIEFFVWNTQTEKPMKRSPFAFTGSKFEKDDNGKMLFMADMEKSVVALKYDVYAIMNTLLDTKDIDPQHADGYSINRYAIPPRGTKCRIIFEPWAGGELSKTDLKDTVEGKSGTGAAPAQPQK